MDSSLYTPDLAPVDEINRRSDFIVNYLNNCFTNPKSFTIRENVECQKFIENTCWFQFIKVPVSLLAIDDFEGILRSNILDAECEQNKIKYVGLAKSLSLSKSTPSQPPKDSIGYVISKTILTYLNGSEFLLYQLVSVIHLFTNNVARDLSSIDPSSPELLRKYLFHYERYLTTLNNIIFPNFRRCSIDISLNYKPRVNHVEVQCNYAWFTNVITPYSAILSNIVCSLLNDIRSTEGNSTKVSPCEYFSKSILSSLYLDSPQFINDAYTKLYGSILEEQSRTYYSKYLSALSMESSDDCDFVTRLAHFVRADIKRLQKVYQDIDLKKGQCNIIKHLAHELKTHYMHRLDAALEKICTSSDLTLVKYIFFFFSWSNEIDRALSIYEKSLQNHFHDVFTEGYARIADRSDDVKVVTFTLMNLYFHRTLEQLTNRLSAISKSILLSCKNITMHCLNKFIPSTDSSPSITAAKYLSSALNHLIRFAYTFPNYTPDSPIDVAISILDTLVKPKLLLIFGKTLLSDIDIHIYQDPAQWLPEIARDTSLLSSCLCDFDMFKGLFLKTMTRRLLSPTTTPAFSLDESLITVWKQVIKDRSCIATIANDLTRRMSNMITDIAKSTEFTNQFRHLVKDSPLNAKILQSNIWPITSTHFTSPIIFHPQEEHFLTTFETYYKAQYPGRKLIWQHGLSSVQLRASFHTDSKGIKEYTFTCTPFQLAVLKYCERIPPGEPIFADSIAAATSLNDNELYKIIQSLVTTKLFLPNPSDSSNKSFLFNDNYANKLTSIKLSSALPKEATSSESQESQATLKSIEQDRICILNCTMVKIMKSKRTLSFANLVDETIRATLSFKPDPATIKTVIDSLIEKEYIKRSDTDTSIFEYLA
jgi:hypothetical protein